MTRLFGMLHTANSAAYTPLALDSFWKHTQWSSENSFILIDNDHSYTAPASNRVEIVANTTPQSFAANANTLLKIARERRANLILLNNDLIFTPAWDLPLFIDEHTLTSPFCNQQIQYETPHWKLQSAMSIAEFLGHADDLELIAAEHRARPAAILPVMVFPFFAAHIPLHAQEKIGLFDESFGIAGGEDFDYCLRAYRAGLRCAFVQQSFLLHFGGKSSWSGAESSAARQTREQHFLARFREKWGQALGEIVLDDNLGVIERSPELQAAVTRKDFGLLIQTLAPQTKE
jgi:hypothetical protein